VQGGRAAQEKAWGLLREPQPQVLLLLLLLLVVVLVLVLLLVLLLRLWRVPHWQGPVKERQGARRGGEGGPLERGGRGGEEPGYTGGGGCDLCAGCAHGPRSPGGAEGRRGGGG